MWYRQNIADWNGRKSVVTHVHEYTECINTNPTWTRIAFKAHFVDDVCWLACRKRWTVVIWRSIFCNFFNCGMLFVFFFFLLHDLQYTVIGRYYWFSIYRKHALIFLLSSCQNGLQVKRSSLTASDTTRATCTQGNRKQVVKNTGVVRFCAQCIGRVTVRRVPLGRC